MSNQAYVDRIVYFVQTNESIQLKDKTHHDIKCAVQEAVEENKHYHLYWNELKLWLKRNKVQFPELSLYYNEVLQQAEKLERGQSIR